MVEPGLAHDLWERMVVLSSPINIQLKNRCRAVLTGEAFGSAVPDPQIRSGQQRAMDDSSQILLNTGEPCATKTCLSQRLASCQDPDVRHHRETL